jgi:hypothetical protein
VTLAGIFRRNSMKTKTIAELTGAEILDRNAAQAERAEATEILEIGGLTFHVRYHAPNNAGQETQAQTNTQEN